MIRFAAFCLILTTAATITACDGAPVQPPPPSEEAFHAADTDLPGGRAGQHRYLCANGDRPLVEFADAGLRLGIALPGAPALSLTAPAQGLQYVGRQASATVAGGRLDIARADGTRLSCWRSTRN